MAAQALIFDLDGTVWDSASWFAEALGNDPAGVSRARQELLNGGNIIAALTQAGLSRKRLIQLAHERTGPPPIFEGMAEAIRSLGDRGTPLGVATSLPGSLALPMLEACGLAAFFQTVVHAGVCRVAKPNPASILMALNDLGREPSKAAFYIGDRAVDRIAAERAGVSFRWILHGYEQPEVHLQMAPISAPELLRL